MEYLYIKNMYKNFIITESEKEEILNKHKNMGYGKPINEQSEKTGPIDPSDFLGKTVTLYKNPKDDMKAFQSNISIPQSRGAMTGVIRGMGKPSAVGLVMNLDTESLSNEPSGELNQVTFVKEDGRFYFGPEKFYNEGLKQDLNKFYQTDYEP